VSVEPLRPWGARSCNATPIDQGRIRLKYEADGRRKRLRDPADIAAGASFMRSAALDFTSGQTAVEDDGPSP
jgi:hypothetical protein